jgi:hypothetical protein
MDDAVTDECAVCGGLRQISADGTLRYTYPPISEGESFQRCRVYGHRWSRRRESWLGRPEGL